MNEDRKAEAAAREADLNKLFAQVFKGKAGDRVLGYLFDMVGAPLGENATDGQLRHREGQRWIVGHISRRVEDGRRGK